MPNYRLQVVLHTADNVNANFITNTFHFNADDDSILPTIETEMLARYNAIRTNLSSLLSTGTHEWKWYNMADVEPRTPVRTTVWTFSAALSGTPLPPEVSLCLSFQGLKVSGLPQSRRRGRVYIGPLNTVGIGTDGRPASSLQTAVNLFGDDLLDESDIAATWRWQIYSPTSDGFVDVTDGWVDNEFDTQRRRGRPYTARSVFT